MTQYVICALQMEGFHCWPEADGELAYLKNSHRHIFFITAEFPVRNANREIEILPFSISSQEMQIAADGIV